METPLATWVCPFYLSPVRYVPLAGRRAGWAKGPFLFPDGCFREAPRKRLPSSAKAPLLVAQSPRRSRVLG
jgi:hypothetical protein